MPPGHMRNPLPRRSGMGQHAMPPKSMTGRPARGFPVSGVREKSAVLGTLDAVSMPWSRPHARR